MYGFIRIGLFRRKVKFRFDLAALKQATGACRLNLGEFFTSDKISDDLRFLFHSYGAWLNGREHTPKLFIKYSKLFNKLTTNNLFKIKRIKQESEILSTEYIKALNRVSESKKKL